MVAYTFCNYVRFFKKKWRKNDKTYSRIDYILTNIQDINVKLWFSKDLSDRAFFIINCPLKTANEIKPRTLNRDMLIQEIKSIQQITQTNHISTILDFLKENENDFVTTLRNMEYNNFQLKLPCSMIKDLSAYIKRLRVYELENQ